jgi:hypothetical protein
MRRAASTETLSVCSPPWPSRAQESSAETHCHRSPSSARQTECRWATGRRVLPQFDARVGSGGGARGHGGVELDDACEVDGDSLDVGLGAVGVEHDGGQALVVAAMACV